MNEILAFLPTGQEWFWIFLAILLLFGAPKLPALARGLAKSLGEFKKAKKDFDKELEDAVKKEDKDEDKEKKSSPQG